MFLVREESREPLEETITKWPNGSIDCENQRTKGTVLHIRNPLLIFKLLLSFMAAEQLIRACVEIRRGVWMEHPHIEERVLL